jgi:hypothetical protein
MPMISIAAGVDLEKVAHEIASWLSATFGSISAVDWILLAVSGAILYLLRASLLAAIRVGPVEVDLLDCDAGSDANVHALTATLRERLADSGLGPSPLVPAGTPRAKVIEAVAASPIPQAGFIAKAVEVLPIPEPVRYELSGTLARDGSRRRISYQLHSSDGQRSLMETLPEAGTRTATYERLMELTAFNVYAYISSQTVQAFPAWTRWSSIEALKNYRQGCAAVRAGEWGRAQLWLAEAAKREPGNALARLQLANVYELAVDANGASAGLPPAERRAREQAEALRLYLGIASAHPHLVQARYRASVLASALAGACAQTGDEGDEATSGVARGLGLLAAVAGRKQEEVKKAVKSLMRGLAKSESDAVLQLLKPWYLLVRERRLRSQFEPSAEERRRLKRVVGISRHCLTLRSLAPRGSGGSRAKICTWVKVRYCEAAVYGWHLCFGLIRVDWQTHYVAACFDALLLEGKW